jgi:hypothetical protein
VKNAADYLAHIKALVVAHPQVIRWVLVREEAQGNMGLYRYRLTLQDGSLLEMFERFQIAKERVQIAKYSFHWQSATGQLMRRWDNVAHHPELHTHPHHVHVETESDVQPHGPISTEEILAFITQR